MYADPSGLVKIWVAWSPVLNSGFDHAFIIIKDEKTGSIFIIEGGPGAGLDKHKLIGGGTLLDPRTYKSRNGKTAGDEYNSRMSFSRMLVHDDDLDLAAWISKYRATKPDMSMIGYKPLNGIFQTGLLQTLLPVQTFESFSYSYVGNSNSYVREVLESLGLATSYPTLPAYTDFQVSSGKSIRVFNTQPNLWGWDWDPWKRRDSRHGF